MLAHCLEIAQNTFDVLSPDLKRSEILRTTKSLPKAPLRKITINIHRNHAFEPIASVIAPFLYVSGLEGGFIYSDYDDSLNFQLSNTAEIEIIFLDLARYMLEDKALKAFLKDRIETLRARTKAPIILLTLDSAKQTISLKGENLFCFCISHLYEQYTTLQEPLIAHKPKPLLDEAKEAITGTRLSNAACLALAQILGLKLIPSLVLPALKAIVCDLDNTLYAGILGEEGIDGLSLTKAHKALQSEILAYKQQGLLLAIASKNQYEDIRALFEKRKDFPLRFSCFDSAQISWETKDKSLKNIAKAFNIGLDSLLFIDDNIAEIESIKYTKASYIHATSPQDTRFRLFLFPRLTKLTHNKEDSLRAGDIAANTERKSLESLSTQEYFQNLALKLDFRIDDSKSAQRIYELMNKTNQFIANYTRPDSAQVHSWLADSAVCVVTISMQDRLSDSGLIGIVVGAYSSLMQDKSTPKQNSTHQIHILDIVISCRALGRRLESIMLMQSFCLIRQHLLSISTKDCAESVLIHYKKGERNVPFLKALSELANKDLESTQLSPITLTLKPPNTKGLDLSLPSRSLND